MADYENKTISVSKGGEVQFIQSCMKCNSIRQVLSDRSFQLCVKTTSYKHCDHFWGPFLGAWSDHKLSAGEIILVRRGGYTYAIKLDELNETTGAIRFTWAQQSDNKPGSRFEKGCKRGEGVGIGRICFGNVDIQIANGRIWFDRYYPGTSSASKYGDDPHGIAFLGQVNIEAVDPSDPQHDFKTWEDGR